MSWTASNFQQPSCTQDFVLKNERHVSAFRSIPLMKEKLQPWEVAEDKLITATCYSHLTH